MTTLALQAPRALLRDFLGFLRRPALLAPQGLLAPGALWAWLTMLALHMGVLLFVVSPLVQAWMAALGLPAPDAFGEISAAWLPWIVVVIAPVGEEALFRGWQSGRPRALWLLACALVAIGALVASTVGLKPIPTALVLLASLIVAPVGWWILRRRATPAWFAGAFPVVFYTAVVAFAAMHVINYPSVSLLILPLVLPQLWAGLTLGYTRQRFGLVAAMLQHATSNAAALGLAMAAG